ncbi:hypothetical protein L1049_008157 [Liquidambar formosana]|uniref:Neprosin PEP catalytic domain-containing protein n=1 Tax=Liquidambar formosana TaxID=63359 RepID=A0AAP0S390_LIQFO
MGSGHFLEEGVGKSSCFRNIQIVDASNNVKVPKGIGTFTEQSNCYDVQTGSNGDWGHSVYYGGPDEEHREQALGRSRLLSMQNCSRL